jgi:hypothetical protein|nr:MAG TPA: YopX protein [Caudoviricetes sp.]
MREIKFRVWNTLLKKYLPDNSVCILPDGDMVLYNLLSMLNVYKNPSDILEGEDIIERWTGLKDKNGKDIYEGDICSFTSKTGKHIGVVEWLDNLAGFGLRMVKNNFRYTFSGLDTMGVNLDTLKVIGNIHENPELVEEK